MSDLGLHIVPGDFVHITLDLKHDIVSKLNAYEFSPGEPVKMKPDYAQNINYFFKVLRHEYELFCTVVMIFCDPFNVIRYVVQVDGTLIAISENDIESITLV